MDIKTAAATLRRVPINVATTDEWPFTSVAIAGRLSGSSGAAYCIRSGLVGRGGSTGMRCFRTSAAMLIVRGRKRKYAKVLALSSPDLRREGLPPTRNSTLPGGIMSYRPWHFLNFFPLPHGHGLFRGLGPGAGTRRSAVASMSGYSLVVPECAVAFVSNPNSMCIRRASASSLSVHERASRYIRSSERIGAGSVSVAMPTISCGRDGTLHPARAAAAAVVGTRSRVLPDEMA
jgi:hypothetical protein